MRVIALIALLLAVGASSAHAATLTLPDGSAAQPEQSWVDSSLVPSAPGAVPYFRERCPDVGFGEAGACYWPTRVVTQRVIERRSLFYGAPTAWSMYRVIVLHEVGHDFDAQMFTDAHRAGFIRIMRYRTPSWTACRDARPGECQSAQERFADAYSLCARRSQISAEVHRMKSGAGYGYYPTPSQHRRVCALIRRAAA